MAEKKGLFKRLRFSSKNKKKKKSSFVKDIRTAYRSIEDPEKVLRKTIFPIIFLGLLIVFLPLVLELFSIPIIGGPYIFPIGGSITIVLGILYPYITWKNKEVEINENMHFFITHLRVLAISDLSLKDLLDVLGGKKVYKYLGEEIRKIAVLSIPWKTSVESAFRFISDRTPSKMLKDLLDRFSQSVASGTGNRIIF